MRIHQIRRCRNLKTTIPHAAELQPPCSLKIGFLLVVFVISGDQRQPLVVVEVPFVFVFDIGNISHTVRHLAADKAVGAYSQRFVTDNAAVVVIGQDIVQYTGALTRAAVCLIIKNAEIRAVEIIFVGISDLPFIGERFDTDNLCTKSDRIAVKSRDYVRDGGREFACLELHAEACAEVHFLTVSSPLRHIQHDAAVIGKILTCKVHNLIGNQRFSVRIVGHNAAIIAELLRLI